MVLQGATLRYEVLSTRYEAERRMAQLRVNGSRLRRDCRGEACLARRVRRTRIVIILYISSAGEACLARPVYGAHVL